MGENQIVNNNVDMEMMNFFGGGEGMMSGFEDLDQSDLSINKIKLLQMQSPEAVGKDAKGRAGQFYNVQTEEAVDELNCHFLSVSKVRAAFPETYTKGNSALCSSIDCKTGVRADGTRHSCEGCKMADWNYAKQNGKDKPPCTMSYVWLGVVDGVPFRFLTGGAAFKIAKKHISQLATKGAALYTYSVKLTSELADSKKGSYFEPRFEFVGYTRKDIEGLSVEKKRELLKTFTERDELLKSLTDVFNQVKQKDVVEVVDMEDSEIDSEVSNMF